MKVKIFQAWGHAQVQALERQINHWLEEIERDGWEARDMQLTAAGTGTSQPGDEIAQSVVITVWIRRIRPAWE